jgi:hypothetical protein
MVLLMQIKDSSDLEELGTLQFVITSNNLESKHTIKTAFFI